MSYCGTVRWTLLGAAIGAGQCVWMAIHVERLGRSTQFVHATGFGDQCS